MTVGSGRTRSRARGRLAGRLAAVLAAVLAVVLGACSAPAPPEPSAPAPSPAAPAATTEEVAAAKTAAEPEVPRVTQVAPAAAAPAAEATPEPDVAPEPELAGQPEPIPEAAPGRAPELEPEPEPEPELEPERAAASFSEADRALFWASPEDAEPEVLLASRKDLQGRHYLTSDENNLHLFYDALADLGGAYVGVGTDQAYLFASWMQAELVWLADYDPWVRALHWAYLAFFAASDTPEELVDWWGKARQDDARELLATSAAIPDEEREFAAQVFRKARLGVHIRLRRLRRIQQDAEIPSFVSDAEHFQRVKRMCAEGRVRPMVGNLFGEKALIGAAQVCEKLQIPVRAVYLSNAEGYWRYPDEFRANLRRLPYDDASIILRTRPTKKSNEDYAYAVQPAGDFLAWLERPTVRRIGDIWGYERVKAPDHAPFRQLGAPPSEEAAP